LNTKCKELGYVIEGLGKVVVDDREIILNKGDLILIEPGEKFF
jgi:quercetin dioxygenase-like cupin family protein